MSARDDLRNQPIAEALCRAIQLLGFEVYLGPSREHVPHIALSEVRAIQKEVCKRTDTDIGDLLSRRAHVRLTAVRHLAIWLSVECTHATSGEIGMAFVRDHSSVKSSYRRWVSFWSATRPDLAAIAEQMKVELTAKRAA